MICDFIFIFWLSKLGYHQVARLDSNAIPLPRSPKCRQQQPASSPRFTVRETEYPRGERTRGRPQITCRPIAEALRLVSDIRHLGSGCKTLGRGAEGGVGKEQRAGRESSNLTALFAVCWAGGHARSALHTVLQPQSCFPPFGYQVPHPSHDLPFLPALLTSSICP